MSDIFTRLATEDDAELIAEFGACAFRDAFGPDNRSEDMDIYIASTFTADNIKTEMSNPTALFFLAYVDHKLCGYAKLVASNNPAEPKKQMCVELERIYVAQNTIGYGVGSRLMVDCLEAAEEAGYYTIWLGVWEKNEKAMRFYEKWGFLPIGKKKFKLGNDIQNDFILQRPICVVR